MMKEINSPRRYFAGVLCPDCADLGLVSRPIDLILKSVVA